MKFKIVRDNFLKALLIASRVSPQKSTDPILCNLKLELVDKGLYITGTNGIISIKHYLPIIVNDKQIIRDMVYGGILVNSFLLTEIIKRIDGDEVSFEVIDDSIVRIENDKSNFKLNGIRLEEFKDIDFEEVGAHITLLTKTFSETINQVSFAVSQKDNRPQLTAVNIESDTSKLIFTATDGARLARKELDVTVNEKLNANIPGKTLQEVLRTISTENAIEFYISDKKVLFCLDNTLIQSTLIVGDYPNTRNIIPKVFYYSLEVNSNELVSAMERVSLFSSDREFIVKLTMSENKVEVSSKSQQIGSGVENINNFKFKGDRLEISFNNEYVKSAIKALNCEDVTINFLGEMKPFTILNKNDNSVIQLITPVRTY